MKTYAAILFCAFVASGAYLFTGNWKAVVFAGLGEFAGASVVWACQAERR